MKLTSLSESILLIDDHHRQGRKILRESCEGLTKEQQYVVETVYKEFIPLIEVSLTTDQIKQIFGAIEKSSIEGGQSRTIAGKGIDVAKKANEIIDQLGAKIQDTAPVKAFDQKFEQLKSKVAEKFPDLAEKTAALGNWVKENPGKSALVIGILTALASLAGGPVGGAIAGQVLRGAQELLKGEKLSTAIGKGIKTAAYGFVAGWLLDGIGDWLAGLRAEVVPYDKVPGLVQLDVGVSRTISGFGQELKQAVYKVYVPEDLAGTMKATIDAARGGDVDAFNQILEFSRNFSRKDYLAGMEISNALAKGIAQENDLFLKGIEAANKIITAAAQGAVAGKMAAGDVKVDGKPIVPEKDSAKESYYLQNKPLSEGQVYMLFDRVLLEAGIVDKIKAGASWLGKQATEKVTSAKLLAAWKIEGSPTDSEELKKFLVDYGGVTPEIVNKVYQDLKLGGKNPNRPTGERLQQMADQLKTTVGKIPTAKIQAAMAKLKSDGYAEGDPIYDIYAAELAKRKTPGAGVAGGSTSYAQVKDTLKQLNNKDRQRLISYLQKQLGTA